MRSREQLRAPARVARAHVPRHLLPFFHFLVNPRIEAAPYADRGARARATRVHSIWDFGLWLVLDVYKGAGWLGGGSKNAGGSLEPESNRWPFDDPCIHYSRTLCQLSYRRRSVWTPQVAVWHAAVYKPQKRARDKRATKSLSPHGRHGRHAHRGTRAPPPPRSVHILSRSCAAHPLIISH